MKNHVICLFQEPQKAEKAEPAKEEPKPEAKAKNRSNQRLGSPASISSMYFHHKFCEDISADVVEETKNGVNFGVLGRTNAPKIELWFLWFLPLFPLMIARKTSSYAGT